MTAGSGPSNSVGVDPATNRINTPGYAYDAAGNMTSDGANALVYDPENRVTSSSGSLGSGTYAYDGYGQRIAKTVSGAATVYIFSNSQVIAEYASGAAPAYPAREYVYSGGAMIAKIENSATQGGSEELPGGPPETGAANRAPRTALFFISDRIEENS